MLNGACTTPRSLACASRFNRSHGSARDGHIMHLAYIVVFEFYCMQTQLNYDIVLTHLHVWQKPLTRRCWIVAYSCRSIHTVTRITFFQLPIGAVTTRVRALWSINIVFQVTLCYFEKPFHRHLVRTRRIWVMRSHISNSIAAKRISSTYDKACIWRGDKVGDKYMSGLLESSAHHQSGLICVHGKVVSCDEQCCIQVRFWSIQQPKS